MPTKIIVKGPESFFFICSRRLEGSIKMFEIVSFREFKIVSSTLDFLISMPTKSLESSEWILSTTCRATLFSKRVISNSGKIESNCSWVRVEVESLYASFLKKPCFSIGSSVSGFFWRRGTSLGRGASFLERLEGADLSLGIFALVDFFGFFWKRGTSKGAFFLNQEVSFSFRDLNIIKYERRYL